MSGITDPLQVSVVCSGSAIPFIPRQGVSGSTLESPDDVLERLSRIDFRGAFFLTTCVTSLFLSLAMAETGQDFLLRLFLCYFMASPFYFVRSQLKKLTTEALVPLSMFRHPTVLAAATYKAFSGMSLIVVTFFLPFYFQILKGSISSTGHYSHFPWVSAIICALGCGLLATLDATWPPGIWISYQCLVGISSAASIQVPYIAVQLSLDGHEVPVGTSILMFSGSLTLAIAIAISQSILNSTSSSAQEIDPSKIVAIALHKIFVAAAIYSCLALFVGAWMITSATETLVLHKARNHGEEDLKVE
ncbi:hypothetical protein C8J56DRAFT_1042848 [Mycena floridula]|nr:hypothetical protein C8J56DRAFT_1042848 [Mycena floridula]